MVKTEKTPLSKLKPNKYVHKVVRKQAPKKAGDKKLEDQYAKLLEENARLVEKARKLERQSLELDQVIKELEEKNAKFDAQIKKTKKQRDKLMEIRNMAHEAKFDMDVAIHLPEYDLLSDGHKQLLKRYCIMAKEIGLNHLAQGSKLH